MKHPSSALLLAFSSQNYLSTDIINNTTYHNSLAESIQGPGFVYAHDEEELTKSQVKEV
jgi:hypothetical protein